MVLLVFTPELLFIWHFLSIILYNKILLILYTHINTVYSKKKVYNTIYNTITKFKNLTCDYEPWVYIILDIIK